VEIDFIDNSELVDDNQLAIPVITVSVHKRVGEVDHIINNKTDRIDISGDFINDVYLKVFLLSFQ